MGGDRIVKEQQTLKFKNDWGGGDGSCARRLQWMLKGEYGGVEPYFSHSLVPLDQG